MVAHGVECIKVEQSGFNGRYRIEKRREREGENIEKETEWEKREQ